MHQIAFIDLKKQYEKIQSDIESAIHKVLAHGQYIFGPEVKAFEEALKSYTQAPEVISCSNGTDALKLLLMAKGVKKGDAVLVPTFTFAATAEVVALLQATPVFVDICPNTYNMDLLSVEKAIHQAKSLGLNLKGMIAVDLFGLPANYTALKEIASANGLWVISDAAQSFGSSINDQKMGTLAEMTTTSFFPAKPLGGYGDGGAIFTSDLDLADYLRAIRNHGSAKSRYDHEYIGLNGRLDSIQAAILLEKLKLFPEELTARQAIANQYEKALAGIVKTPFIPKGYQSAWALYTVQCDSDQRAHVIKNLENNHIPYNIYYRKPVHLQPAYEAFPRAEKKLTQAESLTEKVLSIPMHPYLTEEDLAHIVAQFN